MAEYDEIDAMKQIATALEPLDDAARLRALQWALSRFHGGRALEVAPTNPRATSFGTLPRDNSEFQTFAELFNAAHPSTERDKALVAAFWIQTCQGMESFPAQILNDELKHLGHGIGNITDALSQLKNDRPALALQLKKSGTSKQARKLYKLTHEGLRRIQQLIENRRSSAED